MLDKIRKCVSEITNTFEVKEHPNGVITISGFYGVSSWEVAEHVAELWGPNIDIWNSDLMRLEAGCDTCGWGATVALLAQNLVDARKSAVE